MREFIKVMKALSDPNRVKILKILQRRVLCVCEIQAAIGLAHQLADGAVRYYAHQIRQDLVNRGILQP